MFHSMAAVMFGCGSSIVEPLVVADSMVALLRSASSLRMYCPLCRRNGGTKQREKRGQIAWLIPEKDPLSINLIQYLG